jgi:hypothetical protein
VQVGSDAAYIGGKATDIILAPAGVQILASLLDKKIHVLKPVDTVVNSHQIPTIYDITPVKGAKTQGVKGQTFVIGGANFNYMGARCDAGVL